MLRISVLAAVVFCVTGAGGVCAENEVLTDDFSEEVAGRWEALHGEWTVKDGRMVHTHTESPDHDMLLAEFPFSEGMIEVTGIARKRGEKYPFASIGIVARHLDEKNRIYFRFGSYNAINVDGSAPGFRKFSLGRGGPELDREYRLTVIVRNGVIGVCIDDRMIGVLRDPFAGKTGRVGLFTETGAEFDDVRITRYAP